MRSALIGLAFSFCGCFAMPGPVYLMNATPPNTCARLRQAEMRSNMEYGAPMPPECVASR